MTSRKEPKHWFLYCFNHVKMPEQLFTIASGNPTLWHCIHTSYDFEVEIRIITFNSKYWYSTFVLHLSTQSVFLLQGSFTLSYTLALLILLYINCFFSPSKHLMNILTHWHSHSDGYFEVNSGLGILPKGTLICKLGEHSSPRGIEPSTSHLVDKWLCFWRPSSYCFSIQSNNFFFFPQVYLSLCWEIFYRHWDLL